MIINLNYVLLYIYSFLQKNFNFFTPEGLKQLLSESLFGKQILSSSNNFPLSNAGRKFVVETVARYHLAQDRKTSAEILNDYSNAITALFIKENKVIMLIKCFVIV